jgi:signal peptidase II
MEDATPRISMRRALVFVLLAVAGLAADLASKHWFFHELGYDPSRSEIVIVPNLLVLETHLNEGALFGMGQGRTFLFAGLSVLAVGGIVYWLFWGRAGRDRLLLVALGLVTGGILGNLYDRLGVPGLVWHRSNELHQVGEPVYAVRDFIHFHWVGVVDWPVFNIADSLLVCGAALLLWHAVRGERPVRAADPQPTTGNPAG